MTQTSAFEYLRRGQTPFFRLPVRADGDLAGMDAVILGVTHDAGTTYQPGARFAPFHVRRVSALLQSHHPTRGVDVFDRLRVCDGGNAAFPPFEASAMREAVEQSVGDILAAGAVPIVLGGDHSIALPCLRAVAAKHGPVAVVHVDAHLDTSGPEVWGADHHHGTPLRHAIAEGLIARDGLMQIGLRATWGRAGEGDIARNHGARLFFMDEVERRGIAHVMSEVRERIGGRPTYVTFDVDGVDPAYAPGTGTPVPGGLTSREALALMRGLPPDVVGLDVVEVAPGLDHADLTSHLAATLLYEGLAAVAVTRAPS